MKKVLFFCFGLFLIYGCANTEYSKSLGTLSGRPDVSIRTTESKTVISDVNKDKGNLDSDESVLEIEKRLQDQRISVDADHLGELIVKSKEMIDILDEAKEPESGEDKADEKADDDIEKVNFKDVHICKGCGKPLSQCTCKIEIEDKDMEECTQPSSVGQHKTSCIDLI